MGSNGIARRELSTWFVVGKPEWREVAGRGKGVPELSRANSALARKNVELEHRLAERTTERDDVAREDALADLARTNAELKQRLAERTIERDDVAREEALTELARTNAELKQRLAERTIERDDAAREEAVAELLRTNAELKQRLAKRTIERDDAAREEALTQLSHALTFVSPDTTTSDFGSEDIAYLEVLGTSIARLLEVNELTDTLREAEERSRQHAARLEALWGLVNDPSLRDEELWPAMLAQAVTAMQPGHPYRGTLWRIHNEQMIVEAFYEVASESGKSNSSRIGFARPLATTRVGQLLADGGGTRSWDDARETPSERASAGRGRSRALVVTTFSAGGTLWALTFTSARPAKKRLRAEENAYIEILASFFANRVQQRWQYERIQFQQSHDVLTGLLSRSQFRAQARTSARTGACFAVIVVDINAFREVNETYGHMIGDAILVEVGSALLKRASGSEIVARVGGDVFAIYIANPVSRDFVLSRAVDFASVFAEGFSTGDGHETEFISRTANLGIAVAPENGTDFDAILSRAEAALLNSKQRGQGITTFFELGMEGDAHRRATLRNELAEAISGNQFTLYYQPHVELRTGAVTGCEALIRWNHPERGLVLPGNFIPFAEQSGIITAIDDWVLRNACEASKELGAMRAGFRLFFNLSGRQAGDPKLIRALSAAARKGVALENLGVEITESDAMRDVEATRRVCRALRKLNVRVAIDDFGTGYSSLSFLKRLPVDIVKIDRSFISGVLTDPHDETIAETIISISERFGFQSLAEGAEQPEEIEWLRDRSCHYVQGYAICRPLPMEEFKSWLNARPK